jgi:hypothetical protein
VKRRLVRGCDVRLHNRVVLVDVAGPHPRTVPVDDPFDKSLFEIAKRVGGEFLIGGGLVRANVGEHVTRDTNADGSLPDLDFSRLVSTWRLRHAIDLGFDAFLHAAGLQSSATLFDLIRDLEEPTLQRVLRFMADGTI